MKVIPLTEAKANLSQGGREGLPFQTQLPISGIEAVTAGPTAIVGSLQAHLPQRRLKPLRASTYVAGLLAAPTALARGGVRTVLVQMVLDGPRCQLQDLLTNRPLERFQVQSGGRLRAD